MGVLNSSVSISGDGEWRERLLAVACLTVAATMLTGPFLYWAIVGEPLNITAITVVVGLLVLSLPSFKVLTIEARSWTYCFGLIIVVAAIGSNFGFAPALVGTYNLLLLTVGLLLGKRAMVLVTVLGVGGFVLAGFAVDAGVFAIDTTGRAPDSMQNWARATAMFGVLSVAVVAVVRFATREVDERYDRVKRELVRATKIRIAAEKARDSRLERERELRGAQKLQAVGALSGGLAHLFNNAFTVVRSVLESLQEDTSESNRARAKTRLSKAIEPAVRAAQDLMVFSRREVPEAQSIEIGPLLAEFAETLGQTVPKDVNLRFSTSPGLTVRMNPGPLKQLLLNLVLNAAEATSVPGKVQVTVAPFKEEGDANARWAAIAVEDDGCGMDAETLSRALDPFYSRKTGHSGLGLPVAHAIATRAGGDLRIESNEGTGTRVLVLLPLEAVRTGDDAESLWPIASALHGSERLEAIDVADHDEQWSDDPTPEPAWQDDVTRRLGRITAAIVFILIVVVSVIVPHMRPLLLTVGPVSVALMAVAGWAGGLSGRVARACLVSGFWIIGAAVVFRAGFDNMAGTSIVLIAIAWAGLLGGRWGGFVAAVLTVLSFLLAGALRSGPVYYPPASNSDPNVAANWFRFAPQLALYSLVLSTSVLGALAAVRRGAENEQAALNRVEDMRRREAEEGARLLALETSSTRSERAAAAGQAAGTVAHDLMNAVQALMGSVELLADGEMRESDVTDLLAELAHATAYAEALTTQFDSTTPIQDQAAGGHYPACKVSQVIETMVGLMRSVLPERIELVSVIEPNLVARVSETDLRRLTFNLITNARDAIEGVGAISVSLRPRHDRIVLAVRDTGCGMDDTTKAQMFHPFFSTKEHGQGTGLGLHSVDEVIRRTRGSIDVESLTGEGTCVTVTWPAETRRSVSTDSSLAELEQPRPSGGTVLLAEDQPMVRKVMAEAIRGAGFDVVEAGDGDEGKRLALQDANYVAACIDGVMPGAPSSEVVDCFQGAHPGRPVIICSGHMPVELAERNLVRSGVTFLAKPFPPSRLRGELRAAIEQSS